MRRLSYFVEIDRPNLFCIICGHQNFGLFLHCKYSSRKDGQLILFFIGSLHFWRKEFIQFKFFAIISCSWSLQFLLNKYVIATAFTSRTKVDKIWNITNLVA